MKQYKLYKINFILFKIKYNYIQRRYIILIIYDDNKNFRRNINKYKLYKTIVEL
ncbi:hypothetical protein Ga0061079_10743 [Apibacter mensalis]|uniref:Uncharacterized protein n=1 Tax=Apibacter mensalis TaxID=1586267 RepID=A0A0X3APZ6_9FLAO|nr:hypothetical protein Ga0061079_10743 [Apibacter mensalis]